MYIYFRTSHTVKTIPPTLDMILANNLPTDAVEEIGYKPILSIYNEALKNSSNLTETYKKISPSIFTVKEIDLSSTFLNFSVYASDSSYIYFVVVEKGSEPPNKDEVLNLNYSKQLSFGFG